MVAMVTIALVLSKFVLAYGQAKDPAREQRERFQEIGSDPLNHWPDWRGPTSDGRSDATNLPLNWSEAKNIVWKTRIHDLGHSTPIVWGDQVWLTTATEDGRTLYAVCIDLNSGEVIYDIEVFIQTSLSEFTHRIPMRRLRPWWKKGVSTSTLAPLVQLVSIRKQVKYYGGEPI